MSNRPSPLKSFISGASGGLSVVIAAHPFDLIKVRMQAAHEGLGFLHATKTIVQQHGILGLYRGVNPVLVGTPIMLAINFWAYFMAQKYIYELETGEVYTDMDKLSIPQIGLAGALAALPTAVLLAPAEQIKIRLQLMHGKQGSTFNVIRQIISESGPRGLFRGTFLTFARDFPGSFAYFATYEAIKRQVKNDRNVMPIGWTLIAGDTLKTRVQASKDMGIRTAFTSLIKDGGAFALFKGLGPTLLRAFPASAAFFFGVETSTKILNQWF
ncbi:carnitine transporter [Boothiomyces macroporosus]|uniref:Carnitine transporter n=1 Tax=Boothiomyces macroporosus TaxID=261099 RepID=A0AAD5UBB3_9FUNG|nr:carnitine transporter [Boothiomyces macroporosus]